MKKCIAVGAGALLFALSNAAWAIDAEDTGGKDSGWSEGDEPATTAAEPSSDAGSGSAPGVEPLPPTKAEERGVVQDDPGWTLQPSHSGSPVRDQHPEEPRIKPDVKRAQHGFRMGYLYIANYDERVDEEGTSCPNCSLKERYDLKSPHQFLLGYEAMARIVGHDWLNVILVGNVMVSGLEQSKFLPSTNFLVGFEVDESFQLGVGTNVTFEETKPIHMIVAAGWTPKVGSFQVPVHAFFIPDVDRNHRVGMTLGVNW